MIQLLFHLSSLFALSFLIIASPLLSGQNTVVPSKVLSTRIEPESAASNSTSGAPDNDCLHLSPDAFIFTYTIGKSGSNTMILGSWAPEDRLCVVVHDKDGYVYNEAKTVRPGGATNATIYQPNKGYDGHLLFSIPSTAPTVRLIDVGVFGQWKNWNAPAEGRFEMYTRGLQGNELVFQQPLDSGQTGAGSAAGKSSALADGDSIRSNKTT